jgi:hypothetical protein
MARAFTTNQEITGTTTVARNQSKLTMAGWMRRPTSGSLQAFGFMEFGDSYAGIYHPSDNIIYFLMANVSWGFKTENITGWNHWAFVFDGTQTGNSNRLKGYVNGTSVSLTFTGTIPSATANTSNAEGFRIGKVQVIGAWSTGDFAEIGIYQAALTDSEVASLAKGMTCDKVRPQSLVTYIPLVRDIQDLARGMTLTNTNSTVATHPRVYA